MLIPPDETFLAAVKVASQRVILGLMLPSTGVNFALEVTSEVFYLVLLWRLL